LLVFSAIMTHASVAPAERAVLGISDSLVRLSVGLEDEEDLLKDLDNALTLAVSAADSCHLSTNALPRCKSRIFVLCWCVSSGLEIRLEKILVTRARSREKWLVRLENTLPYVYGLNG
jgi:hypothetical protein